jgi:hypothetical protein
LVGETLPLAVGVPAGWPSAPELEVVVVVVVVLVCGGELD